MTCSRVQKNWSLMRKFMLKFNLWLQLLIVFAFLNISKYTVDKWPRYIASQCILWSFLPLRSLEKNVQIILNKPLFTLKKVVTYIFDFFYFFFFFMYFQSKYIYIVQNKLNIYYSNILCNFSLVGFFCRLSVFMPRKLFLNKIEWIFHLL